MMRVIASIGDLDVFKALDVASKATEQLNKQLDIDKLEEIQERLEDQKQQAEEKADFFIRAGELEDNDELMDELNELEADALANEMESVEIGAGALKGKGGAIAQPAVAARSDDDELKALEAMMS